MINGNYMFQTNKETPSVPLKETISVPLKEPL